MNNGAPEEKRHAALALEQIVDGPAQVCLYALDPLFAAICDEDPRTKYTAIAALGELRPAIDGTLLGSHLADMGAIHSLLALLQTEEDIALGLTKEGRRCFAVDILEKINCAPGVSRRIFEAGGTEPLLNALKQANVNAYDPYRGMSDDKDGKIGFAQQTQNHSIQILCDIFSIVAKEPALFISPETVTEAIEILNEARALDNIGIQAKEKAKEALEHISMITLALAEAAPSTEALSKKRAVAEAAPSPEAPSKKRALADEAALSTAEAPTLETVTAIPIVDQIKFLAEQLQSGTLEEKRNAASALRQIAYAPATARVTYAFDPLFAAILSDDRETKYAAIGALILMQRNYIYLPNGYLNAAAALPYLFWLLADEGEKASIRGFAIEMMVKICPYPEFYRYDAEADYSQLFAGFVIPEDGWMILLAGSSKEKPLLITLAEDGGTEVLLSVLRKANADAEVTGPGSDSEAELAAARLIQHHSVQILANIFSLSALRVKRDHLPSLIDSKTVADAIEPLRAALTSTDAETQKNAAEALSAADFLIRTPSVHTEAVSSTSATASLFFPAAPPEEKGSDREHGVQ